METPELYISHAVLNVFFDFQDLHPHYSKLHLPGNKFPERFQPTTYTPSQSAAFRFYGILQLFKAEVIKKCLNHCWPPLFVEIVPWRSKTFHLSALQVFGAMPTRYFHAPIVSHNGKFPHSICRCCSPTINPTPYSYPVHNCIPFISML